MEANKPEPRVPESQSMSPGDSTVSKGVRLRLRRQSHWGRVRSGANEVLERRAEPPAALRSGDLPARGSTWCVELGRLSSGLECTPVIPLRFCADPLGGLLIMSWDPNYGTPTSRLDWGTLYDKDSVPHSTFSCGWLPNLLGSSVHFLVKSSFSKNC